MDILDCRMIFTFKVWFSLLNYYLVRCERQRVFLGELVEKKEKFKFFLIPLLGLESYMGENRKFKYYVECVKKNNLTINQFAWNRSPTDRGYPQIHGLQFGVCTLFNINMFLNCIDQYPTNIIDRLVQFFSELNKIHYSCHQNELRTDQTWYNWICPVFLLTTNTLFVVDICEENIDTQPPFIAFDCLNLRWIYKFS